MTGLTGILCSFLTATSVSTDISQITPNAFALSSGVITSKHAFLSDLFLATSVAITGANTNGATSTWQISIPLTDQIVVSAVAN